MRKKVLAVLISAILMIPVFALPVYADDPPIGNTTVVQGRILSGAMVGDSSNWVEIARNGGYSLIVRQNCLTNLGMVEFSKQNIDAYSISAVRDLTNNWFNNTLSSNARVRNFTVKSTALSDLGYLASPNSGISKPTNTPARTGADVAFLLSFGEVANFCSLQYATSTVNVTSSPATAKANFNMLVAPGNGVMKDFWWLRSPGLGGGTKCAASVGTHGGMLSAGTAYQSSSQAPYPYVRPALWVKTTIFDNVGTVNVIHKDKGTGENLLAPASHRVNVGNYGPYNAASFPEYKPGYLAPGSDAASGTIALDQVKTVTYLYERGEGTINAYHVDAVTGAILSQSSSTVTAGAYGPINAEDIRFYLPGVLAGYSNPIEGRINHNQTLNITYLYTRGEANVIVRHIDVDSGALLWEDDMTVPAGSYGPYATYPFDGYDPGFWVSTSAATSGTIDIGESITIVFAQKRALATVNVSHMDQYGITFYSETLIIPSGNYGPYNHSTAFGPSYLPFGYWAGSDLNQGFVPSGGTVTILFRYFDLDG